MNTDRIIGIIGFVVSVLGIVAIPKMSVGWVTLATGIVLISFFVFKTRQPEFLYLFSCFIYDFTSGRDIVKGRKLVLFKVTKPGITRLEATGLTSTGRYENFKSNIPGRLSVLKDDGGALKVRCDLEKSLRIGKEINWILSYDLVDSFDSETEEVCIPCLSKCRTGALHVVFSPEDPPIELIKVVSKNGIDMTSENVKFNHELPEVYWRFPIKFGLIYTFRWQWKAQPS
ncbi:MAG: hypothetical protein HOC71_02240 [Candidatus Latescibacteria bacterium]|jgi:hypothetical protein|nr:hypothetical protein [Candidatus Latescibacterota bacterium]